MDAKLAERCEGWLVEIQDHLRDELLPFWLGRGVDSEHGGFLTYFDRDGRATGETVKTLVGQTRMVFTFSSMYRAGFAQDKALSIAQGGVEFLIDHFWDEQHGGWFWTTERDGSPLNESKIGYGHSFAMYALSEYGMASGDLRGMEWAVKTFETFQSLAADNLNGGYYEFCERDWTKKAPGRKGGDRKSLDVHMHLMEAFTNLYEATGAQIYHDKTREMIGLISCRMLHPEYGTGIAQFTPDWTPQREIIVDDFWGADRHAGDPEGRPLDNTSYGRNVEYAWLLAHAVKLLDLDVNTYRQPIQKLYDHCLAYGIDYERGGVYSEGPHAGPARDKNKEFWQQAEALVGLLDAHILLDDEKYLDGYQKVHRFVFDHVINHEVGEWFPLFDEQNVLLRDDMAHAWKTNFHTVRSMIQSEARLLKILI